MFLSPHLVVQEYSPKKQDFFKGKRLIPIRQHESVFIVAPFSLKLIQHQKGHRTLNFEALPAEASFEIVLINMVHRTYLLIVFMEGSFSKREDKIFFLFTIVKRVRLLGGLT